MEQLHQRLRDFPHYPVPTGEDMLALLNDLAYQLDPKASGSDLQPLINVIQSREFFSSTQHPDIVLQIIWLLADDIFDGLIIYVSDLVSLLLATDTLMATRQPAIDDEDQREELIRLTLNGLRLKPEGETDQQAKDRLLMVSSSERARVVAASRAAEERAEAIRKALAQRRAREAADKYTRE